MTAMTIQGPLQRPLFGGFKTTHDPMAHWFLGFHIELPYCVYHVHIATFSSNTSWYITV
jgi:hypothetical protein